MIVANLPALYGSARPALTDIWSFRKGGQGGGNPPSPGMSLRGYYLDRYAELDDAWDRRMRYRLELVLEEFEQDHRAAEFVPLRVGKRGADCE